MAERIEETSYHFGSSQNVIETNKFVYQVTLYKYYKRGVELLDTKLFASDKLLKIKPNSIRKKEKDCFYIKYIDLIGVPLDFIKQYELEVNIKPCKKKRGKLS